MDKDLKNALEVIEHLLDALPKQACILIPAPEGAPYKMEEIPISHIGPLKLPIYKKFGKYVLHFSLTDGTERKIRSKKKSYLNLYCKDIQEWRNN